MGTLGIIAGGGELPIAIAESVEAAGRGAFVVALKGAVEESAVARFAHEWVAIGELGRVLGMLKDRGCDEVTLAGQVARPDWSAIKLDARAALALPKVAAAAFKGDDAILRAMVAIFEKEGFRVIGTAEAAPGLLALGGAQGRRAPDKRAREDIALAARVIRRMGEFDIGQAAAVCDGLVLAVEAAEGTDAMLARVATLPVALRGTPARRRGVLVKTTKPGQERRVDLPVIGAQTVERVAAAGLAGIAVEAGASLLVRRAKLVEAADRHGIFIFGFDPAAYSA